jgi:hypothetical protein
MKTAKIPRFKKKAYRLFTLTPEIEATKELPPIFRFTEQINDEAFLVSDFLAKSMQHNVKKQKRKKKQNIN